LISWGQLIIRMGELRVRGESAEEAEETNHDHACITPTTGFILADTERRAEGCDEQERDGCRRC
jgi:hypothetical protein